MQSSRERKKGEIPAAHPLLKRPTTAGEACLVEYLSLAVECLSLVVEYLSLVVEYLSLTVKNLQDSAALANVACAASVCVAN
jgi:hypothetical protein